MPSKLVERRLNDFKRRCDEVEDKNTVLQLAYHAALPVALNPELLHFLRINFFLDPPEQLPYTVEFKFLTSGLCREIDVELYEIEPEIRENLLKRLMERKDASQRVRDVATLLWQYIEYHSPWADRIELVRAQQLTALNFLNPKKAKQWLDKVEENPSLVSRAEREWFIAMRREIDQLSNLKIPSGQQRQLWEALIDAFPNVASLEQMLSLELDKNLRPITGERSLQHTVFELIQAAYSEGWVEDLVNAALHSNPGNSRLKTIAELLLQQDNPLTTKEEDYSQLSPEEMFKQLTKNAKLRWSQTSGDLRYIQQHIVDASNSPDIKLHNFILEAKFYNPYNGTDIKWKYGFSFRETNSDLNSPQRQVYTMWISSDDKILSLDGYGDRVEAKISKLDVLENSSNQVHLLVFRETAIVYINNIYTQKFDILDWMTPGKVYLVSAGYGNISAKFESWKVMSISN